MKEQLYTIPLNDAFHASDECPFCFIERSIERDLLDFVLGNGSSYMESHVREATDKAGFCRNHYKKMYDYGNTLGNAWILKTYFIRTNHEMSQQFKNFKSGKLSFKSKLKKTIGVRQNSISAWLEEREHSCYICNQFDDYYERYMDTFFVMYKRDEEFRKLVKSSKGFCLTHFSDLCESAETKLNDTQKTSFYPDMFTLMEQNMKRLEDDVTWLVDKFDYRNHDADWKNSKDAAQRGMQKMKGGYPGDSPYKMNK
ncbi:MAG TPA: DUF6062 family protein [Lachnospiraceae bacterium]|nr:DUF6062 family protein [Lachnospiraceae bacterium]